MAMTAKQSQAWQALGRIRGAAICLGIEAIAPDKRNVAQLAAIIESRLEDVERYVHELEQEAARW